MTDEAIATPFISDHEEIPQTLASCRHRDEVVSQASAIGIDGDFPEAENNYLAFALARASSLRRDAEDDSRQMCESEIERRMFVCLQLTFVGRQLGTCGYVLVVPPGETPPIDVNDENRRVSVLMPQRQINQYRVDFIVQRHEWDTYSGAVVKTPPIVIECDGHDFHERTKEQAQRDKARDRDLQTMGYVVLRFTGSEIFNDGAGCAMSVENTVSEFIDREMTRTFDARLARNTHKSA